MATMSSCDSIGLPASPTVKMPTSCPSNMPQSRSGVRPEAELFSGRLLRPPVCRLRLAFDVESAERAIEALDRYVRAEKWDRHELHGHRGRRRRTGCRVDVIAAAPHVGPTRIVDRRERVATLERRAPG